MITAEENTTYLPGAGISPRITYVVVNVATKAVYVQMTADVSPLFPEFLQVRPTSAWGEAQVWVCSSYWHVQRESFLSGVTDNPIPAPSDLTD
jgi:hypothetical protein